MAAKIAVQTQLASIRKTGEQTKANTDELLQRAQGKLPEKRPDQTAAERKRELDQALASVPAWRAERKETAALARQEADRQRAAIKGRAAALRRLSTADLRAKLDAIGADSRGSKAVLVRRLAGIKAPSAVAAESACPIGKDAGDAEVSRSSEECAASSTDRHSQPGATTESNSPRGEDASGDDEELPTCAGRPASSTGNSYQVASADRGNNGFERQPKRKAHADLIAPRSGLLKRRKPTAPTGKEDPGSELSAEPTATLERSEAQLVDETTLPPPAGAPPALPGGCALLVRHLPDLPLDGGAGYLKLTVSQSATCSTTSGATSPTASTGSHEATVQQSADGAEALAAEDTEAARPPKESAVDPKLRHTDAAEVFDAKGRFSHWAPLTVEGLCGHPCPDGKLCSGNAGDCLSHRRRERTLMEREDERAAVVEHGHCGVPLGPGGACEKPRGRCGIHTDEWHRKRELRAMRAEDDASCAADRGLCGVLPRCGGGQCDKPRGRCPNHAEEKARCQSTLDSDPRERCWN